MSRKNISYLFLAQGSLMFGPKGYRLLSQTHLAPTPHTTHHGQGYRLSPLKKPGKTLHVGIFIQRSTEEPAAKMIDTKLLLGKLKAKTKHVEAVITHNLLRTFAEQCDRTFQLLQRVTSKTTYQFWVMWLLRRNTITLSTAWNECWFNLNHQQETIALWMI